MTSSSSLVPVRLAIAVFAAILALPVAASAQSLADVARKESSRRKEKPAGKVYTNDSLRRDFTASAPEASTPPDGAPAGSGAAAPPPAPQPDQAPEGAKKDEAYWRERIGGAREQLERSQAFAAALESQINGLTTEFLSRDDPAQRSAVEGNRKKAIAEHERVKREIEAQRKVIVGIEDEARKAGVPAGWLR